MNLATLKIGVASHSKEEKVSDSKLLVLFNSILIGVSIVSGSGTGDEWLNFT